MKKTVLLFIIAFLFTVQVQAHPAWGIAVDKEKNIYFADIFHNGRGTVWKLTNEGKLIALLKDFHAHNVSLDKDGNLYTAHGEGTHRLVKISPDGKRLETIVNETDETKFFGGNATVSKNGNIYFGIRKHIWKYTKDGETTKFNPHKLEWNQTVFVDENEDIYVSDIGVGNGTLFKLRADGKVEKIAADLISKLDRPKDKHNDVLLGIAKDQAGFIYIAELAGRRIIKILKNGKTENFYKSGDKWLPTGMTFSDGETYIREFGTDRANMGPRIIKIDKTGKKTELLNYGTYQEPVANNLSVDPGSQNPFSWNWLYFLMISGVVIIGFIKLRKLRKRLSL